MFQGTHGHYDFTDCTWHRAWERPTRDEARCCEAFTLVRDQVVYRKLADDPTPITVDDLVKSSGINVGRWMDRYDAALQILTNNMWITYVEHRPARSFRNAGGVGHHFGSEQFLRNSHNQVCTKYAQLELSGRALSMRVLPSASEVVACLGEGILR